ncbi:IucC family-domain-containing protein [Aspergillus pseudoustus]|uniref:IucC family-domain-containing protein n=1 Tax=Aspergillus pseudoustus TaxID=1810923 RepID=A0ABR4L514_9EURO
MTAGQGTYTSRIRRQALFETTKRVLATAVNDGLASATINTSTSTNPVLCLRSPGTSTAEGETWIKCGIRASAYFERSETRVVGLVRADDLLNPVLIRNVTGEISEEQDPGLICRMVCDWQPEPFETASVETLVKEVRNSTDNQAKWLEIASSLPVLHLKSPLSDWEQSVIYGHPTHPLHRACLAQSPLAPIPPEDIPELLEPELSFISVPRSKMKIFGPYPRLLEPLLESLGIPNPEAPDRIVVPCFTRQLPSILPLFPEAYHIGAVRKCCRAQISMRTVSLLADVVGSPLHLKLSLNCQITSGPRTITPWTAALGPALGKVLRSLLPADLWIFEEAASITGAQEDFDKARHLTCILRESPEKQAEEHGETLIPVAGLFQKPFKDNRTYMEIIFGLEDSRKKQIWFRKYIARLFSLILPPLVRHGIGLESHSQNILVRVNTTSKEVTGFAVRDFGGIRIHAPAFSRSGVDLPGLLPPGAQTVTDNVHTIWHKVHHALLQVHVGHLLYMLGLESHGGWPIVREELERALDPLGDPDGRAVHEYLLRKTMPLKCFMEMRLRGIYRDYYERELPNILLRDMDS